MTKQALDELQAKYRTIFRSQMGQDVLSDILAMTHFGETLDPDNKARVAEYNVGIAILARIGVFSEGTTDEVVRALVNVSPSPKEEAK